MTGPSPESYRSPFFEQLRPATPLWKIGNYSIVRCRDSQLVYLSNPLTEEQLREFYSTEYFEGDTSRKGYASYQDDELILRLNFRLQLRRMLNDLKRDGADPAGLALLDYGCAYGFFLAEAKPLFQQVKGIEVNDDVARIGRRRFQLDIQSGINLEAGLAPESVDIITMWDVIEHLSRPRSVIQACQKALRPSGRLYITTGDIDSLLARLMGRYWRLINPPQHISYFSVKTLSALLRDCGMQVVEVRRPGRRVSLGFISFIINYMLGRNGGTNKVKANWLMRRGVYMNLFDVMLLGAKKL